MNECPRLLDSLRIAVGDGSLAKRFAQLAKIELLILDDFGFKPLTQAERPRLAGSDRRPSRHALNPDYQ
jgi:DNA replication protein DnaC